MKKLKKIYLIHLECESEIEDDTNNPPVGKCLVSVIYTDFKIQNMMKLTSL